MSLYKENHPSSLRLTERCLCGLPMRVEVESLLLRCSGIYGSPKEKCWCLPIELVTA